VVVHQAPLRPSVAAALCAITSRVRTGGEKMATTAADRPVVAGTPVVRIGLADVTAR